MVPRDVPHFADRAEPLRRKSGEAAARIRLSAVRARWPIWLGWIVGWAWAIIAGGGGFGLILTEGPLPLTHGWYAMFSGIALCPATAWLLKRYAGIELSFVVRLVVAAAFIAAGRLALIIGPWPIGPH